jgi:hypothetical protein
MPTTSQRHPQPSDTVTGEDSKKTVGELMLEGAESRDRFVLQDGAPQYKITCGARKN